MISLKKDEQGAYSCPCIYNHANYQNLSTCWHNSGTVSPDNLIMMHDFTGDNQHHLFDINFSYSVNYFTL